MDQLVMYSDSRHISVVCAGHLFTLEVVSEDGTLLEQAGIATKLDEIVAAALAAPAAPGLAVLTADDRDVWVRGPPTCPARAKGEGAGVAKGTGDARQVIVVKLG
jgi:hypothetical protein